jgi:hypothetical protein
VDDQFNFVDFKSKKIKHRIPIFVVDNTCYYTNMQSVEGLKKPIAQHVANLATLHPVVTV